MSLNVKFLNPDAKLPELAHEGEDLGYDVFAAEAAVIYPGDQVMVSLGFACEVEPIVLGDKTYKMGLIAKQPSGLARKRKLAPMAGVIDAGYRDGLAVILYNYGTEVQNISIKDKIAQLVPLPVFTGKINVVDELTDSLRGTHGWGSNHKGSIQ